jgi:hypothetical protein
VNSASKDVETLPEADKDLEELVKLMKCAKRGESLREEQRLIEEKWETNCGQIMMMEGERQ